MNNIFFFKTKAGLIEWTNQRAVFDYLLQHEGNMYAKFGKYSGRRSSNQNDWYWSAVLPTIANYTGHTEEELHRLFKGLFLPKKMLKFKDKEYSMSGSTTQLNKTQFGEYIERIRAEVASLGIEIPQPTTEGKLPEYPELKEQPTF